MDNDCMGSFAFSFVLGFAGSSTIPTVVALPIVSFVRQVYIQRLEIRKAFLYSWLGQIEALKATPVVLTYRDVDGVVQSEALTYSVPDVRVWGLSHRCGNGECWCLPGDLKSTIKKGTKGANHSQAKFLCFRCKWTTGWVT